MAEEKTEIVKEKITGETELNSLENIKIEPPSAPLIKPKRSLSPKQLEVLKKGREKLAQKKSVKETPKLIEQKVEEMTEVKPEEKKMKRQYRKRKEMPEPELDPEHEHDPEHEPEPENDEVPEPKSAKTRNEFPLAAAPEQKSGNDGLLILALIGLVAVIGFFLLRFWNNKTPSAPAANEGPDYSIGENFRQTTSSGAYPVRVGSKDEAI